VRVALRKATPARSHHEGDEQPRLPPLPGDSYPSSGHALSDPPGTVAHRPGSLSEVLTSTTAGPTSQRSAFRPVASPTDRTIRPHRRALYRPRAAFSAWAAQMTSVATERDPAMVRARAQSRRSARGAALQGRPAAPRRRGDSARPGTAAGGAYCVL